VKWNVGGVWMECNVTLVPQVLNAINGVYPSARVSGRQCPMYNDI